MNNHISILGICCCRDIFGLRENNGDYIIDRFCQSVNPVALSMDTMLLSESSIPENIYENKSNFYKRCISLDLKKQVFNYFAEVNSDYLIIDAGSFRKRIFFSENHMKGNTLIFPDTAALLFSEKCIDSYIEGDVFDLPEQLVSKYIDSYIDSILRIYPQEKIVLFEFYNIDHYYDESSDEITENLKIDRENRLMRFGFLELRKRLPNAHVVYFPAGVVGDVQHKWGKGALHYVKEFYDYCYECFEIIVQNLDRKDEELLLLKKKREFEELFSLRYLDKIESFREKQKKEHNTLIRLSQYEQIFKTMLLSNKKEDIIGFLIANKIAEVGIYGLSEITKVLIPLFKQYCISVQFIVENSFKKEFEGIPVIGRKCKDFPVVDAMIICDLNHAHIKRYLEKNGYAERIVSFKELFSGFNE